MLMSFGSRRKIAQKLEQYEQIVQDVKKEFQQQKNKTQHIDQKYQRLMRPRLRKSVKRIVQEYEANVKKANNVDSKIKQIDEKNPKLMKPVTTTKFDKAFKGAARSYEVSITNDKDPLLQLNGSNKSIKNQLKQLLVEMKSFKLNITLKNTFKRPQGDNTLYKSAYFNN